jgi:AcrR family transcriptional regulator
LAENSKPAPRGKRERLTQAAVELAHRQGYRHTTLADLAVTAQVPLGNIYYYFKSKDDIGRAVLEQRLSEVARMEQMLSGLPTPLERLLAFVENSISNAQLVAELGCPLGSLSAELSKDEGDWTGRAKGLLGGPMAWMETQFAQMGFAGEAADLALQLQSSLQGASLLAQSLNDPELLVREGRRLQRWLQTLSTSHAAK